MKRNTIRLTEGQLHRVIKESVKRVITEMENEGYKTEYLKNMFNDGRDGEELVPMTDADRIHQVPNRRNHEMYKFSYDTDYQGRHSYEKARAAANTKPGIGGKLLRGAGQVAKKLGQGFSYLDNAIN